MFQCFYFQNDRGDRPVRNFIYSLDLKTQTRFYDYYKLLLEDMGPLLREPYAKKLQGAESIYELRFHGKDVNVRILYFFDDKSIVLTNAFKKKKDKTPRTEIEIAEQRRRAYFLRKTGGKENA